MVYILEQTNTETNTDGKTHISQCQVVLQAHNKLFPWTKRVQWTKFHIYSLLGLKAWIRGKIKKNYAVEYAYTGE